jgi:chromosome segregation protein
VARARRYQKLKAELASAELNILWRSYERLQAELAPLEQEMKRSADSSLTVRSLLRVEEAQLEELRTIALTSEKELAKIRSALEVCVSEIAALETENATLDTRANAARDTISHAERTRILLEEKQEVLARKRESQESERQKLTEALRAAEIELAAVQKEYQEQEKTLEDVLYRAHHHDKHLTGLRTDVTAKGRHLSEKEAALAGLTGRRETHQQELAQIVEQKKVLEAQAGPVTKQEKELQKTFAKLGQEEEALQQRHETQSESVERAEESLRAMQQAIDLAANQIEMLKTLYERGPRSNPALKFLRQQPVAGLVDLLGDALDVPETYARAFAAILGPAAYYYLVESSEAAFEAIDALQQSGAGQAVFVPIRGLQMLEISQTPLPEGTLGRAIDFLNGRLDDPIACHFLGKVVIVRDWAMACALQAWGRENDLTLVSLDGEWITPQGFVCGGAAAAKVPADFGLKKQISLLKQRLDESRANLTKASHAHEGHLTERTSIEQDLMKVRERIASFEDELTRLRESRLQRCALQEHLDKRQATIETELATLVAAIESANREIEMGSHALSEAQERMDKAVSSGSDLEKEMAAVRRQSALVKEKYHRAERQCDDAKHRLEIAELELQGIVNSSGEIVAELQGSEERAIQASKEEGEIARRKSEVEAKLLEKFRRRDGISSELDRQNAHLDEARGRVREQENKLRTLRTGREEGLEGERKLEREVARLHAERDALVAGARSKYGLDLSSPDFAATHTEIISAEIAEQTVADLAVKIEQLEPVNLLAIEEFEQENARLQTMVANRDDLLRAKTTLEETISRINETAQERFLETFGKVRANFQRLFREFFGTGEADLILSGTDLLEADVTLWANPSGKRLKSLSLMSGGEKAMTAIALLFALYQVKPSPFCILDEVDAPLDDTNIVRFNEMIRRHSEETQFILVTHNKRTMEAADTLWGITMEEDGVSKVVSVRLLA